MTFIIINTKYSHNDAFAADDDATGPKSAAISSREACHHDGTSCRRPRSHWCYVPAQTMSICFQIFACFQIISSCCLLPAQRNSNATTMPSRPTYISQFRRSPVTWPPPLTPPFSIDERRGLNFTSEPCQLSRDDDW